MVLTATDQHQIEKSLFLFDLVSPVSNLSVNDHNKRLLGAMGIIDPLLKIISTKTPVNKKVEFLIPQSRIHAAKILWNMAFVDKNKERIKTAEGIEKLKDLAKDPETEPELVKNIVGILWMLDIKGVPVPELETTQPLSASQSGTPKPVQQETPQSDKNVPHIMISYNWGVQHTVKRLAHDLKQAGYKIWLDIEQMKGSTLEAMAAAVEGSVVVLICMTEKYKDSPNCRLEGEYCSQQKKAFIPLLLQEKYQPTGWLGLLLGAKLYHNFANDLDWDSKMALLINEIGDRGKLDTAPAPAPVTETETSATTTVAVAPVASTPAPTPVSTAKYTISAPPISFLQCV